MLGRLGRGFGFMAATLLMTMCVLAVPARAQGRADTTYAVVTVQDATPALSLKLENMAKCTARLEVRQDGQVLKRLELTPLGAKIVHLTPQGVESVIEVAVQPLGCDSDVGKRYVVQGRVPSSSEYLLATLYGNADHSVILPRRP